MSKFITRVQLQKAEEKDYEKLNSEMEKASFYLKRGHPADKAANIKRGEYNCRGYISLKEVADAVYRAVKKTGLDYSFTIMRNKAGYSAADR